MMRSLVSKAVKEFKDGQYHLSLDLYRSLGERIEQRYFKGSVELSRKKMHWHWPMYFSRMGFLRLIEIVEFYDAENLIYADIDLNTVDGSAVWLSSMTSVLSLSGKTILLSKNKIKRNVVVDNILNKKNVLILTPDNFEGEEDSLGVDECVSIIRNLDSCLGELKKVVVRGSGVAKKIVEDRRFYKRIYAYLTDFYEHASDGTIRIKDETKYIDVLARQAKTFLVQTELIEDALRKATKYPFDSIEIPPPVLKKIKKENNFNDVKNNNEIVIGYAGKIAPNWGLTQLIEWVSQLRIDGMNVKVLWIGDKISGAGDAIENRRYRSQINTLLSEERVVRLGALSRDETIQKMALVDFSWCWRPPEFEDNTLELSTKLVEGVVSSQVCLVYPSKINIQSLGVEYPFFVKDYNQFKCLIKKKERYLEQRFVDRVYEKHSILKIAERFDQKFSLENKFFKHNARVCVATHDPKFIFPYFSYLKERGVKTFMDQWEWGAIGDEERSRYFAENSDVVFCEWGLANSVWYSNNLPEGKRLIVRLHQQEIRQRAAKFGRAVNKDRVDLFIFVSEKVREEAIRLFGFDPRKTVVVPNFVLDKEYCFFEKNRSSVIKMGMVGIIPQTKRFDLSVKLLAEIIKRGYLAELHIKGPRPEELEWMRAGSRVKELDYYYQVYSEIDSDRELKECIKFHGWGNDVAKFYEGMDFILSPSDFESFHYALADGVLSGCWPILWSWGEAKEIYDPSWVVNDISEAADRVIEFSTKKMEERLPLLERNRNLIIDKYGMQKIFGLLDQLIF